MNRKEWLQKIIEIVDPLDPVAEDTVIADSDDFDSLALFNIVMFFKASGLKVTLEQISKCKKVAELIDLVYA